MPAWDAIVRTYWKTAGMGSMLEFLTLQHGIKTVMPHLTQARLRELLRYDPNHGSNPA